MSYSTCEWISALPITSSLHTFVISIPCHGKSLCCERINIIKRAKSTEPQNGAVVLHWKSRPANPCLQHLPWPDIINTIYPLIMPRSTPPILDKERSPLQQPQPSQASSVPASRAEAPLPQPIQSTYSVPGTAPIIPQPTYSETILQRPILATDPSTLPAQQVAQEPSSATSRRRSSSSMRNASMTFENITPTATPTGRVSKAKKGKRVHACEFPGCGKVSFTVSVRILSC